MKGRSGFTLVELAIVLVIIGLILGAVLKGQALIQNAKYKKFVNDLKGLTAAVYTYYDRYRAYPGDDPAAYARWHGDYSRIRSGNGDGLIQGSPTSTRNRDESVQAWRHLMAAGIIPGDPNNANANALRPASPYGGHYGFEYRNFGTAYANCIFVDNVPKDIAQRLDEDLDDGVYNTGSIQASSDYTGTGIVDVYYRL